MVQFDPMAMAFTVTSQYISTYSYDLAVTTMTRPCPDLPAWDRSIASKVDQFRHGTLIHFAWLWTPDPRRADPDKVLSCLTVSGAWNIYLSRRMWQAAAIDCPTLSKTSVMESQKQILLAWYGEAFWRITDKSHKIILACLCLRLCAAVSKALNQRIGFPSIPLRLANLPNIASLRQESRNHTNYEQWLCLHGHPPKLDLRCEKHDRYNKS